MWDKDADLSEVAAILTDYGTDAALLRYGAGTKGAGGNAIAGYTSTGTVIRGIYQAAKNPFEVEEASESRSYGQHFFFVLPYPPGTSDAAKIHKDDRLTMTTAFGTQTFSVLGFDMGDGNGLLIRYLLEDAK